jgi:putative transposase
MDRFLDEARTGPLSLRIPEIASLVVEAIRHRTHELKQFELHAYVVTPDHVHLLITPTVPVFRLTHSLKRFTAREANRVLGLTGDPFWQDESYDRVVRDGAELQRIRRYIECNPVRGGLATSPEESPWSSAWPIDRQSAAGYQPAPHLNTFVST